MAVTDFLEQHPNPSADDIDREITNICRCSTYVRIRKAIHLAAEYKRSPNAPTGVAINAEVGNEIS
jgi:aerobic-type carbon monoxide dehydrogenase small subunit (CoxS/CutS family)